ncbi:MAG: serine phosphatase [Cyanobacteria bacterium RYN_339]|nr:serine phosphatase [Cyanobacteria bacterium RYN_339]
MAGAAVLLGFAFLVLRATAFLTPLPHWLGEMLAALAVALGFAYGREDIGQRVRGMLAPKEPDAPDFRHIVGEFAASTRESLDVDSIAEAFMTAVDEALGPHYQVILVKTAAGPFEPLAARRCTDAERFMKQGPREDELLIPLRVGEKIICRLILGPRQDGVDYQSADFALIDSLGQSLALSVRNAQLFHQLAGQERLKRELEIAFEVQMGLLPKSVPTPMGALLSANCTPALEVGGDLYDFVQIDSTRWGVFIGDVSGKGVPAALMMAVSLTLFRALAPGVPSPASTLARLNKLIHRNRPSNKIFVAAIYMIYDARDGSVLIANAGHPKPLLDGKEVEIKGMPLGISARTTYREEKVFLPAGSTLVAYSDGLEDVESEQGEQFGPERVMAFFREHAKLTPEETRVKLVETLAGFAGRAQPADDQTVTILQKTDEALASGVRTATRQLTVPANAETGPLQT